MHASEAGHKINCDVIKQNKTKTNKQQQQQQKRHEEKKR